MSAISAGQMMVHRCDVIRDANRGLEDAAGNTLEPDWQEHLTDVPCYFHADFRSGFSGEFGIGNDRFQVTRTLYRLMIPNDVDITNFDRITQVRKAWVDTVIYDGLLGIDNEDDPEHYTVYYLTERR